MREFLAQCLKHLEPLTGIRQVYYLEIDPDGKAKINKLIEGCMVVCKQFDFIPESAQQGIIKRMMIEDQQYDAFNSRTLTKWFSLFREKYMDAPKEDAPRVQLTPEENERIDAMLNNLKAGLLGEAPKYGDLEAEKLKIKAEDKHRTVKPTPTGRKATDNETILRMQLHNEWIGANFDKLTGKPLETFVDESVWTEKRLEEMAAELLNEDRNPSGEAAS